MLTENDKKQIEKLRDEQYAARWLPLSSNKKRVYPGAKVKYECKPYKVIAVRSDKRLELQWKSRRGVWGKSGVRASAVELIP